MRFFATLTEFGIQEFCAECSKEQDVSQALVEIPPTRERCCDSCGAWRDGIGAGRRVFA